MRTRVRQLDDADLSQTIEFLSRAPVANVFLLSRIRQGGLDSARLGCPVHGVFRGGELVGLVHIGANLVPVIDDGRDSAVVDALASKIGRWRRSSSIMGADVAVLPLYERLAQIGPDTWGRPREVRSCQPLLAMSDRPRVVPDARVVRINERHFEPYFRAAVAMYTEEVGVSPLDPGDGYRRHMLELVRQGRGLAAPAMAAVVELARRDHDTVSLYVNDFNTRALRTYRRVGFERIGTMATLLY